MIKLLHMGDQTGGHSKYLELIKSKMFKKTSFTVTNNELKA